MSLVSDVAARFDDVCAGYVPGRPVIEAQTWQVHAGDVVRLAGPRGAGKSTSVEVLGGYLRPSSGTVTVLGHDPRDPAVRPRRRIMRATMGLLNVTVAEQVQMFAKASAVDPDSLVRRAEALGLGASMATRTRSLWVGAARKLWFLGSTIGRADLVVLDDPFDQVDADGAAQMVAELARWARDGSAVMLISDRLPADLVVDAQIDIAVPEARPAVSW